MLDSRKNLIPLSKLCNDNYSISFNKTFVSIMKENEVVTCDTLMIDLYVIQVNNVKKIIEKEKSYQLNLVMTLKVWSHKFEKNTKISELLATSHFDPTTITTMSKLYSR